MRETSAQNARHRLLDFYLSSFRFFVQESLRCHNDGIQAKTALRGAFFDERFLKRMRLLDRSQSFQSGDLSSVHGFHGRDAGANRLALHNDGAGSALAKAATKLRSAKLKIVGQHIEQ